MFVVPGAGRDVREFNGRGRELFGAQKPPAVGVNAERAGHHGGLQSRDRGGRKGIPWLLPQHYLGSGTA